MLKTFKRDISLVDMSSDDDKMSTAQMTPHMRFPSVTKEISNVFKKNYIF